MDVKRTTGNAKQMKIAVLNIVAIFYRDLTYLVIRVFAKTKNISNNIAPNFNVKCASKNVCYKLLIKPKNNKNRITYIPIIYT